MALSVLVSALCMRRLGVRCSKQGRELDLLQLNSGRCALLSLFVCRFVLCVCVCVCENVGVQPLDLCTLYGIIQ